MSTQKEIKKEEKVLEKELKKVDKAIDKDIKKVEKADKKIDKDVGKGKAETQVTKDVLKKADVEGDLQKHVVQKEFIGAKLDNLGNPILVPGHTVVQPVGVIHQDYVVAGQPAAGVVTAVHSGPH